MNDFENRRPLGEPEIDYLVPHNRRPHGFPVSRDWEDIDCRAVGCQYNHNEKCMTPSRCKIGEKGECIGFSAKPLESRPLDGD